MRSDFNFRSHLLLAAMAQTAACCLLYVVCPDNFPVCPAHHGSCFLKVTCISSSFFLVIGIFLNKKKSQHHNDIISSFVDMSGRGEIWQYTTYMEIPITSRTIVTPSVVFFCYLHSSFINLVFLCQTFFNKQLYHSFTHF